MYDEKLPFKAKTHAFIKQSNHLLRKTQVYNHDEDHYLGNYPLCKTQYIHIQIHTYIYTIKLRNHHVFKYIKFIISHYLYAYLIN